MHSFQSEVFESQNTESVGELWVGLLRFYAVQFDQAKFVISLRQRKKMSREEKKWTSKRLALEGHYPNCTMFSNPVPLACNITGLEFTHFPPFQER